MISNFFGRVLPRRRTNTSSISSKSADADAVVGGVDDGDRAVPPPPLSGGATHNDDTTRGKGNHKTRVDGVGRRGRSGTNTVMRHDNTSSIQCNSSQNDDTDDDNVNTARRMKQVRGSGDNSRHSSGSRSGYGLNYNGQSNSRSSISERGNNSGAEVASLNGGDEDDDGRYESVQYGRSVMMGSVEEVEEDELEDDFDDYYDDNDDDEDMHSAMSMIPFSLRSQDPSMARFDNHTHPTTTFSQQSQQHMRFFSGGGGGGINNNNRKSYAEVTSQHFQQQQRNGTEEEVRGEDEEHQEEINIEGTSRRSPSNIIVEREDESMSPVVSRPSFAAPPSRIDVKKLKRRRKRGGEQQQQRQHPKMQRPHSTAVRDDHSSADNSQNVTEQTTIGGVRQQQQQQQQPTDVITEIKRRVRQADPEVVARAQQERNSRRLQDMASIKIKHDRHHRNQAGSPHEADNVADNGAGIEMATMMTPMATLTDGQMQTVNSLGMQTANSDGMMSFHTSSAVGGNNNIHSHHQQHHIDNDVDDRDGLGTDNTTSRSSSHTNIHRHMSTGAAPSQSQGGGGRLFSVSPATTATSSTMSMTTNTTMMLSSVTVTPPSSYPSSSAKFVALSPPASNKFSSHQLPAAVAELPSHLVDEVNTTTTNSASPSSSSVVPGRAAVAGEEGSKVAKKKGAWDGMRRNKQDAVIDSTSATTMTMQSDQMTDSSNNMNMIINNNLSVVGSHDSSSSSSSATGTTVSLSLSSTAVGRPVLVVGATGFLGMHVVDTLIRYGYCVRAAVISATSRPPEPERKQPTTVAASTRDNRQAKQQKKRRNRSRNGSNYSESGNDEETTDTEKEEAEEDIELRLLRRLDPDHTSSRRSAASTKLSIIHVDIFSQRSMLAAIADCQCVIHCGLPQHPCEDLSAAVREQFHFYCEQNNKGNNNAVNRNRSRGRRSESPVDTGARASSSLSSALSSPPTVDTLLEMNSKALQALFSALRHTNKRVTTLGGGGTHPAGGGTRVILACSYLNAIDPEVKLAADSRDHVTAETKGNGSPEGDENDPQQQEEEGEEQKQSRIFKYDENCWNPATKASHIAAYIRTHTEREAWRLAKICHVDLCVMLPALLVGPAKGLRTSDAMSAVIARMAAATCRSRFLTFFRPSLTRTHDRYQSFVDVRDAAQAFVRAVEHPRAVGQRFILSSNHASLVDVGAAIHDAFPHLDPPLKMMPHWLTIMLSLLRATGGGARKAPATAYGRRRCFLSRHRQPSMLTAMNHDTTSVFYLWRMLGVRQPMSSDLVSATLGQQFAPFKRTLRDAVVDLMYRGMVVRPPRQQCLGKGIKGDDNDYHYDIESGFEEGIDEDKRRRAKRRKKKTKENNSFSTRTHLAQAVAVTSIPTVIVAGVLYLRYRKM